jgi:hypothetical protein
MPEGLSPVETGKSLHEHAAEETTTTSPTGERHSRRLQIGEAALLALVTLAAAWAGFAAAKWSTTSRVDLAQASRLTNLATRADLEALETKDFDASTFNAWFIAYTLNNPVKEQIAERRFRPAFRVAFNAWMATDPATNPHAPPGPTYMPEYKLPQATRANALDAAAVAKSTTGQNAGATGDDYVRITVFLAAVLFLVGVGSTFKVVGVRYALVALGSTLLVVAAVLLVQQPGLPG